jgi:hypothetical protein
MITMSFEPPPLSAPPEEALLELPADDVDPPPPEPPDPEPEPELLHAASASAARTPADVAASRHPNLLFMRGSLRETIEFDLLDFDLLDPWTTTGGSEKRSPRRRG